MFEVYLGGRIANLLYEEAMEKRVKLGDSLRVFDILCRNPLRGKSFLTGKGSITLETYKNELTLQEIILRDLHDIDRCNVVLILTGDDPSWGTSGEFWYATWIAKKPTLVVAKKKELSWCGHYATKIVPDLERAIEVLKEWKDYWDDGEKVNNMR